VIHQQWKKFAKNIPYHEHKAQHGDGEQHVHDQLATYKSIDQLHLLAQKLAQIGSTRRVVVRVDALRQRSETARRPTKIRTIC
jgi:hypothetical protein